MVSCGSSMQSPRNELLDGDLSVSEVEKGIRWKEARRVESKDDEFDEIFAKLKIKLSWMKKLVVCCTLLNCN